MTDEEMSRLADQIMFPDVPTKELLHKARELFPDAQVRAAILIHLPDGRVMSVEGVHRDEANG